MAEERGIALAFRNQCQVFFLQLSFLPTLSWHVFFLPCLSMYVCSNMKDLEFFYHLRGEKKPPQNNPQKPKQEKTLEKPVATSDF